MSKIVIALRLLNDWPDEPSENDRNIFMELQQYYAAIIKKKDTDPYLYTLI